MKFNELKTTKQKKPTRAGRGISAGRGKTAGRGTKGQGSRKSPTKSGFEGGQMPLYMRLPKLRGFKSQRDRIDEVYTGQLESLKSPAIDNKVLFEAGLIKSPYTAVKLIVRGELKSKKNVRLQRASQTAIEAVKRTGGSFEIVNRQGRPSLKNTKK